MSDETEHKRRIRYKGTHPRRFQEKYKELDPSAHAQELEKVRERGHTPAGTHRPICVGEILKILPRLRPGGRLFGIDVDPLELPRTESPSTRTTALASDRSGCSRRA